MLWIPEALWSDLLDAFASAPDGVERIGYLDGVPAEHEAGGVVTTLTIPDAELEPGRYRVSAAAMSQAGQHLRAHRLRRLAQIHTHGGAWTGHSTTDDFEAYSQRPGTISIVLPHHAVFRPAPHDGTVHVRDLQGWTPLNPDDARQLVRVVPSVLNHARPRQENHSWQTSSATGTPAQQAGRWARWKQRARSQFTSR